VGKFKIFKEHHLTKTLGLFFPRLYEEYFELWPPTPTDEDVAKAQGKTEVAIAKVRRTEERVSDLDLRVISVLIVMIISAFTDGCTTGPDRSMVQTDRVRVPV